MYKLSMEVGVEVSSLSIHPGEWLCYDVSSHRIRIVAPGTILDYTEMALEIPKTIESDFLESLGKNGAWSIGGWNGRPPAQVVFVDAPTGYRKLGEAQPYRNAKAWHNIYV